MCNARGSALSVAKNDISAMDRNLQREMGCNAPSTNHSVRFINRLVEGTVLFYPAEELRGALRFDGRFLRRGHSKGLEGHAGFSHHVFLGDPPDQSCPTTPRNSGASVALSMIASANGWSTTVGIRSAVATLPPVAAAAVVPCSSTSR